MPSEAKAGRSRRACPEPVEGIPWADEHPAASQGVSRITEVCRNPDYPQNPFALHTFSETMPACVQLFYFC